jgi:hypothetical protein
LRGQYIEGYFAYIVVPLQDRIAEDLGETAVQILERVRELQ